MREGVCICSIFGCVGMMMCNFEGKKVVGEGRGVIDFLKKVNVCVWCGKFFL